MKRRRFASLTISLIGVLSFGSIVVRGQAPAAGTDVGKFGKLPPGHLLLWELSGVRTEIAIENFIDPELVKDRIPPGFRPQTVGEAAKGNPDLTKWLETHPKYSGYLVGTLLFTSLDLVVDGTNVNISGPVQFADWWIWGTAISPLDKFVLDPQQVALQLESWFPDAGTNRRKLVVDPTVSFAKVELANTGPGAWRVRLKTKDGEVTGEVRDEGERSEINYPLPAYSTVFLGRSNPQKYMIFTYYGHRFGYVKANWKFTGKHPLIRSMSEMKDIYPARTNMQDGWRARAGLYVFKK